MVKRRGYRAGWLFAAASALLHAGWYSLLRAPAPPPPILETTIELSVMSLPPSPAVPEPMPVPDRSVDPQPTAAATEPARPRARVVAEPRKLRKAADARETPVARDPAPAEAVAEATVPAPAVASAPELPSRSPQAPSTLDLSPRRAASTMIEPPAFERACSPTPGAASAPACEPADRGDVEVAQRKLNQWLDKAANAPAYRRQREAPELQRLSDGSYRYTGHVFGAQIRPDGHVEFHDRGDATIDGPATIGPGVMGGFDLSDTVEHGVLGKERYSAEKRWFLEQTASLREKLTEAARAEERVNARRALGHALNRILAANLSPEQKRKQILELWESCGDDAESRETRRKVEEFVRLRMPDGSQLGFTREELERFNRGRNRMAAFDPYRKS